MSGQSSLVVPKVYLVGQSVINEDGMRSFLADTGNDAFWDDVLGALDAGLSMAEALTSFYAKLCYSTLTEGKNRNVKKIRAIWENLLGTLDSGHGSVFEHVVYNFVAHNCSRVYETEQVRHRAGFAYSILSGRYYRTETLDVVADPILQQYGIVTEDEQRYIHHELAEYQRRCGERIDALSAPFDVKKKLTSAVRRWLPQGRATTVGFSANLRSIRHVVQLRTSRASEWEIRQVWGQVYDLMAKRCPTLFHDARVETVDGATEVTGMKIQPYEKE